MQFREKLKYLEDQISKNIDKMRSKADRSRNRSYIVSLSSALLGALITIALGVKSTSWSDRLKDAALVCGALIAVVNACGTIFAYRELWVKQKITLLDLYTLKNEIDFYKAGLEESDPISQEKVAEFFEKYQLIWGAASGEWLRLRKEQKQEEISRR